MVSADLPDWVNRLPDWVRDDEVRWLSKRPWIAGFIRELDYSLGPAVQRFQESQRRFGVAHRSADEFAELVAVRGLETTALRFEAATAAGPGVTRSVSVKSPEAARIKGLALPYGERSLPVRVAGIVTLEQFDRDSFEPLPSSCPLRIEHDRNQNLGRVTSLRHTKTGLAVEADVDQEHRSEWTRRWLRGEHSSLSVGFAGAAVFDDWSTWGGFPLRTVRRAQLVEISVVRSPAYASARVIEVA